MNESADGATRKPRSPEVFLVMCALVCHRSHMSTKLEIDSELLEKAFEVSGEKTRKAAVTRALQEFIARREQKRLLDLVQSLEWDAKLDYKRDRSRA